MENRNLEDWSQNKPIPKMRFWDNFEITKHILFCKNGLISGNKPEPNMTSFPTSVWRLFLVL